MTRLLLVLRDILLRLRGKGDVMQDLEFSMRAKGDITPDEDAKLRTCTGFMNGGSTMVATFCGLVTWFVLGQESKSTGVKPLRGLRFGMSAGGALIAGKLFYYTFLPVCPLYILDEGEERMKMELANIILTKHSDDNSMVEAVKRHFVAEHLFSDQHQDRPLFRWRLRHSYIDGTFTERVKEIEANNSNNEAPTISGRATVNNRSFGDLMEDPLACILGSPDINMESNKPPGPERTGTILERDLRANRRSHRHHRRHHHRHVDKIAAL